MKTALSITIVLLLISLFGNYYFWDQAKEQKEFREAGNRLNQIEIQKNEAVAKSAGHRADSIQASFENRRTTDSLAIRAVKIENKTISENLAKLKAAAKPIIDTIPIIRELVLAYDGLLAGKDHEISEMNLRHSAQIVDLERVIADRGQEVMADVAVIEGLKTELTTSQAETKKERKGKKFWQVTTAIVTGVALYLAVRP